ncbi:MAG TPA: alkaline phosphatase family protein [Pirellulales bacterium]|jgi:hypothetical protein|nr:alkaline phosphatase family protein [Pirellulales bacterium]
MPDPIILLTVPGLVSPDLGQMPNLRSKLADGDRAVLAPTCPCTAGPVRANMTTGVTCGQHGIVADRLYIPERKQVKAEPQWSDFLQAPSTWQILSQRQPATTSAVCFVPESHACGAQVTCNLPHGQRALLTHPSSLASELSWPAAPEQSNDPLWMANVISTLLENGPFDFLWCEFSQVAAAAELDGPSGAQVGQTTRAVDAALGRLFSAIDDYYDAPPLWLVVSPYSISATKHVLYPNHLLLELGLLALDARGDGNLDLANSRAWALTDRQISHVYAKDRERAVLADVKQVFAGRQGVAEVLSGEERSKYDLVHERAGDVVVISTPDSWQAAACRPADDPARTVRGSHGAPAADDRQRGMIFSSERGVLTGRLLLDTDVCDLVLRQFGI